LREKISVISSFLLRISHFPLGPGHTPLSELEIIFLFFFFLFFFFLSILHLFFLGETDRSARGIPPFSYALSESRVRARVRCSFHDPLFVRGRTPPPPPWAPLLPPDTSGHLRDLSCMFLVPSVLFFLSLLKSDSPVGLAFQFFCLLQQLFFFPPPPEVLCVF